jgi:LysR family transcriptional regulator, cyn operon transcriptional activator
MNLRHLRTFVAIVDAGGVARAALQLNMTQPTASRQIEALETELGVPLFDRIGRRIQLTSEGEDLLLRGRRLLSDADSFGERARALKSGQIGTLRVGTTPQAIESVLVGFLSHYQPRHPGVEVRIVEDGGARLASRLERGDVHLTIMPAGDERFHSRLVYPVYLLAVLPGTHRLARHAVLEITELLEEPLLLLGSGFASPEWFHSACQVAHIRPRVLLESASPQTVIALAGAGHGVAVIPSTVMVARAKIRAAPLVFRRAPIGRWQVVAWDPRRFLAPYAQQFVEELMAYLRRDYPGREHTRRAPPLPRPKQSFN